MHIRHHPTSPISVWIGSRRGRNRSRSYMGMHRRRGHTQRHAGMGGTPIFVCHVVCPSLFILAVCVVYCTCDVLQRSVTSLCVSFCTSSLHAFMRACACICPYACDVYMCNVLLTPSRHAYAWMSMYGCVCLCRGVPIPSHISRQCARCHVMTRTDLDTCMSMERT